MKLIRLNLMFCFDMSRCKAEWLGEICEENTVTVHHTTLSNNNKKKIYNTHIVKR